MKVILTPRPSGLVTHNSINAGNVVEIFNTTGERATTRPRRYLVTSTRNTLQLHCLDDGCRWCKPEDVKDYLYRVCEARVETN